jgi:hypothetical protein
VSGEGGAVADLVDEIEEVAQLVTRGWQLETGAAALTAEQQQVHDLGMTAGMHATFEVLYRHGMLHLAEEGVSATALGKPAREESAGESDGAEAADHSSKPMGPGCQEAS